MPPITQPDCDRSKNSGGDGEALGIAIFDAGIWESGTWGGATACMCWQLVYRRLACCIREERGELLRIGVPRIGFVGLFSCCFTFWCAALSVTSSSITESVRYIRLSNCLNDGSTLDVDSRGLIQHRDGSTLGWAATIVLSNKHC
jgi:hypothetical protein